MCYCFLLFRVGDGCVAVVFFQVHLRFLGIPITDFNNSGTVEFFKAIMFAEKKNQRKHPYIVGDDFDRRWKKLNYKVYMYAEPDPELKTHVETMKKIIDYNLNRVQDAAADSNLPTDSVSKAAEE